MFKNTYQSGLLSLFFSCGSNPLGIWEMECNNGHIKRLTDPEVNSIVLEIVSTNVATTYITCPRNNQALGIKLPFLVMIVKNLKRYFSFEITILDDKNMRRRFRISNFQSTTKIKPFCTTMPIGLSGGWNQIQFNLSDFTRRAYGTQYIEAVRVQVHANVRLRRIYFAERLYSEEELPQDYKLYLPMMKKVKKGKEKPVAPVDKPVGTGDVKAEAVVEEVLPVPATEEPAVEQKKSVATVIALEEIQQEIPPSEGEALKAPAKAPTPSEASEAPGEVKEEGVEATDEAQPPVEGEDIPAPSEGDEAPPPEGEEPPEE